MSGSPDRAPSPRVSFYVDQIKVRQAEGQALETAVRDVRLAFETNFGPDPDREADISAAHEHIEAELTRAANRAA